MRLNKMQLDAIKKTGLAIRAFFNGAIFMALAMTAVAIALADSSTTFGEFVQAMHAPAMLQCFALGGAIASFARFCLSPPVVLVEWFVKTRNQRLAR